MPIPDVVQPLLLLALVAALTPPLGAYVAHAMAGEPAPGVAHAGGDPAR